MIDHKKGRLLGGLQRIFVEETPDPAPSPAAAASAQRNTPLPPQPSTGVAPAPSLVSSFSAIPRTPGTPPAAPDAGSLKYLRNELAKATSPAYSRFMEQYDALSSVPMDEGTRFKAALASSRTTVADLAQALDDLGRALNATHERFQATYEQSKKKALDMANAQVAATQGIIESRTQQLSAIQEEIQSLQGKLQTEMEAVRAEERRVEDTRAGFEAAYTHVASELDAQRAHVAAQPRN